MDYITSTEFGIASVCICLLAAAIPVVAVLAGEFMGTMDAKKRIDDGE